MSGGLPAITGPELIKLLLKNGWQEEGRVTHGLALSKEKEDGRFLLLSFLPNLDHYLAAL